MDSQFFIEEPIKDHYEIHTLLKEGSFSTIWRVRQLKNEQYYNAVIIHKSNLNVTQIYEIKNELTSISIIQHPNLAQLHQVIDDQGYLYLIKEKIKGQSLLQYLSQHKQLDYQVLFELLSPILDVVRCLHSYQLVHGDLKLEDFIINKYQNNQILKVCGLGINRFIIDYLRLMGDSNPQYLSPEIIDQKEITNKTDIWHLGIIIYVLVSGHFPFDIQNNNINELYYNIQNCYYSINSDIWINTPDVAKDLINNLLRVDPQERYDIQQLINHPFIQNPKYYTNDFRILLKNIKLFHKYNMFTKSRQLIRIAFEKTLIIKLY